MFLVLLLVIFCCRGETLWPTQLTEGRALWGYSRGRVRNDGEGMAVNGHSRKLSDHIFNCNREVEREQELEVRWGCELSKPSTRDVPSPTRLYTTYPNSTTEWGSGAPTPQLIGGALLIQNTTVLITRSIWFWRGAYLGFFFLLFLDPAPSEVLILRSWLPAYLSQETTLCSCFIPREYPVLQTDSHLEAKNQIATNPVMR